MMPFSLSIERLFDYSGSGVCAGGVADGGERAVGSEQSSGDGGQGERMAGSCLVLVWGPRQMLRVSHWTLVCSQNFTPEIIRDTTIHPVYFACMTTISRQQQQKHFQSVHNMAESPESPRWQSEARQEILQHLLFVRLAAHILLHIFALLLQPGDSVFNRAGYILYCCTGTLR